MNCTLLTYFCPPPNPQMSSAKKQIAKTKTTAPSLQALCNKTLWEESIKAGQADELVAALQACPEGLTALRKIAPKPIECIIVNRASSDGINEGLCAYLRRNAHTECLFLLLDQYDPAGEDGRPALHHLGGYNISWDSTDDVDDWVTNGTAAMDLGEARDFFKKTLGIVIPKKDSEGDKVKSAIEYLENEGGEEWHELVVAKVVECLKNPDVIDPEQVNEYNCAGIVMDTIAVFTINEDGF